MLLGLATALHLTADLAGGLAACRRVAAVAEDLGRPELVAEAALVTEPAFFLPEADLVIRRLCEQAIGLLDATYPALKARVLARLAEVCMALGDDDRAGVASAQALVLAEQSGERTGLVAALRRGRRCAQDLTPWRNGQIWRSGCWSSPDRREPGRRAVRALGPRRRRPERGDLSLVAHEIEAAGRCAEQAGGRMAHWLLLRSQAVLAQA